MCDDEKPRKGWGIKDYKEERKRLDSEEWGNIYELLGEAKRQIWGGYGSNWGAGFRLANERVEHYEEYIKFLERKVEKKDKEISRLQGVISRRRKNKKSQNTRSNN